MTVCKLERSDKDAALNILCAAFHSYPVMRYVIGEGDPEYVAKLRELIGLFVEARLMRHIPVVGIRDGKDLLGIAVVSPPEETPAPAAFKTCYTRVGRNLGAEAMARFDRYNEACEATDPGHYSHYLGMIGILPDAQGRRIGRQLIEAVKAMAQLHSTSAGISLNTELESNLSFYEKAGFRKISEAHVGPLHTWSFYWPCD